MHQRQRQPAAPKRPSAIQTSRHLQVAHRRHTGRVTPRRTTSYPLLVLIVLCVGVFLLSWTRYVTADFTYPGPSDGSYTVTVGVPGPPPTQPATIDSTLDGTVVTAIPITVSGDCPVNTYEMLYRNNATSGVALCDASGSYQLQTALFAGVNKLQTRDFSLTDAPGPLSNQVSVTYDPPSSSASSSISTSTAAGNGAVANSSSIVKSSSSGASVAPMTEPLIFKTTFKYQGYYTGQDSSWQLDLEGGTPPYAVSIDWGDGSHSLISRAKAGTFTADHVYGKAGGYRGSYVVKFSASDTDGRQTLLQSLAIVNNPPAGAAGSTEALPSGSGTAAGSGTQSYAATLTKFIWPGYGVVVLMLVSFWLGERRYTGMRPHLKRVRHV